MNWLLVTTYANLCYSIMVEIVSDATSVEMTDRIFDRQKFGESNMAIGETRWLGNTDAGDTVRGEDSSLL